MNIRHLSVVLALAFGAEAHAQGAITFDKLPRSRRDSVITRPRVAPVRVAQVRVDTVRLHQVDTVRTERVDTVRVVPALAAPAAPLPTSVAGMLHVMVFGGDAAAMRSSYRIRRAELKVTSDLGRGAQAVVMVDAAKALTITTSGTTAAVTQSSRVLQDAYVTLPVGRVKIDGGQQRLPLGYEGSLSSSVLETIERALMESDRARGGSFGDVRDVGIAARGSWRTLDYRAGIFNGSGETMNDVDRNAGKSAVAQLAWRPSQLRALRVGMSGTTSGPATLDKPARDRVGAELRFATARTIVQAEAMTGRDGAITREGMYVLAGRNLTKSIRVVTRFDAWDPDRRAESASANVTERDYLAGATWTPAGTRLKTQLAVVRKTFTRSITPSATLALLQLQASW
jgi:hypothetical protein